MRNYGFDPALVEIKPEDYVLGDNKLGAEEINPSGDWTEYLPTYEPQAEKYETYGCTAWGTLSAIESLEKFLFGVEPNYSDRYTYITANIKPPGANPNDVCQAIRRYGVVPQEVMPMPDTFEEFKQPNPITPAYEAVGAKWLRTHEFRHEWVLMGYSENQAEILKQALKTSPVGVSVTAWTKRDGLYVDSGAINNHWCLLFKYEGDCPVVFDTYNASIKKLSPDHRIFFAKRYRIKQVDNSRNWLTEILYNIWDFIKHLLNT